MSQLSHVNTVKSYIGTTEIELKFDHLLSTGLLLPIETERIVDIRDSEDVSSNESDIKFDSESKSSEEIYQELLENLEPEELAHIRDEIDEEEEEDDTESLDCDIKVYYEDDR